MNFKEFLSESDNALKLKKEYLLKYEKLINPDAYLDNSHAQNVKDRKEIDMIIAHANEFGYAKELESVYKKVMS